MQNEMAMLPARRGATVQVFRRHPLLTLTVCLLAFQASLAVANAESRDGPWVVNSTDFGPTAVGIVRNQGPRDVNDWNITGVGMFCGNRFVNPGKINFYLYGAERDERSRLLKAAVVVDGESMELSFTWHHSLAVAPVSANFASKLMRARSLSVFIQDQISLYPDAVSMSGSAMAIRWALRRCLR